MAVPKYHEMYRPFLDCLKDGKNHKIQEVKEVVAAAMTVSEEERLELLPSGKHRAEA